MFSRPAVNVSALALLTWLLLAATPNVLTAQPKAAQPAATPEVPTQVDKVVEVQTKSALKVLQEGRTGVIYIVVRNISGVPIKVLDISVISDASKSGTPSPDPKSFINARPVGFEQGKEVLPQQAQVIRVNIEAGGRIEEGQHLLLFEVMVEWMKDNRPLKGSLFASQDFGVEVFATSSILSVLGASSIIFLPGFLGVTVFLMLKRLREKRTAEGGKWRLELKSPEFWMLALTVSLPAAVAYPWLSMWWFGEKRDYLKGYNMSDVALLWFASIIAAAVIWALVTTVQLFIEGHVNDFRARIAAYAERLEPTQNDTPHELLGKWAKRRDWEGRSLLSKMQLITSLGPDGEPPPSLGKPKKVTFPKGYPQYVEVRDDEGSYFLLEPPEKKEGQVWVVPPVSYRYRDSNDPAESAKQETFRGELDAQIKGLDGKANAFDIGLIADLFRRGIEHNWLEVKWATTSFSVDPKPPHRVPQGRLVYKFKPNINFFNQGKSK